MTPKHSVPYNPTDYLKTPEDIAAYIEAAIKDGNEQVLILALHNVAKALGLSLSITST